MIPPSCCSVEGFSYHPSRFSSPAKLPGVVCQRLPLEVTDNPWRSIPLSQVFGAGLSRLSRSPMNGLNLLSTFGCVYLISVDSSVRSYRGHAAKLHSPSSNAFAFRRISATRQGCPSFRAAILAQGKPELFHSRNPWLFNEAKPSERAALNPAPGTAWKFLCAFPLSTACLSAPPGTYPDRGYEEFGYALFAVNQ